MMRMLTICCALMIGMTMSIDNAEAKRFGGGSSFGKMFSSPKKAAPAPRQAAPTKSTNQTTTTSKPKAGMGGLMGGLLAGGILGALFFGGAFEGLQMMDVLIFAVIAFVLFRFLGRMKQPQQKPQYAGGYQPEQQQSPQQRQSADADFEPTPLMSNSLSEAELELPSWFDKDAFLDGARQHFSGLQKAWDKNDLEEIRSYCEPDFFALLQAEREKLSAAELDNEVVSVMAEVIGFNERPDRAELSVNFYGWMREGTGAQTTEFNEVWHLARDMNTADSDWFIVGIEQP